MFGGYKDRAYIRSVNYKSTMKENKPLPLNALTKGYILVPKQLLEKLLTESTAPISDPDAWLIMLTQVNYKEDTCTIKGTPYLCRRGEALFSIDTWATRFHWTRGKTRCFFARLQRQNLIRLIPNPYTTHLAVNDYDLWTGCRDAARQHLAQQADEAFDHFWETYHYITQADKVNIARARREWRKLSPEERTLAVRHIEEYYYHLRSQKYCMQAAAYLSNKAFLNEYND